MENVAFQLRGTKWEETLSCTVAHKWSINLSYIVISLFGAFGIMAKESIEKPSEGKREVSDTIKPSTNRDLLSATIWKERPTPLASLPEMFAASDFSFLA